MQNVCKDNSNWKQEDVRSSKMYPGSNTPWARGPANYKRKSNKQSEIGYRNVEYVDIQRMFSSCLANG